MLKLAEELRATPNAIRISSSRGGDTGFLAGRVITDDFCSLTRVEWNRARATSECNCEAFRADKRCLHIAAMLMEAEARELLPATLIAGGREAPAAPWALELQRLSQIILDDTDQTPLDLGSAGQLSYLLSEMPATSEEAGLKVRPAIRDPQTDVWTTIPLAPVDVLRLPDAQDRRIMTLLAGAGSMDEFTGYEQRKEGLPLYRPGLAEVLPELCRTGRAIWSETNQPLQWDDAGPWTIAFTIAGTQRYTITAELHRLREAGLQPAPETLELTKVHLLADGTLFIADTQVGLIGGPVNLRLLDFIQRSKLDLSKEEITVLLKHLAKIPGAHELHWPADLGIARETPPCNPILICALLSTRSQWITEDMVTAEIEFAYGQTRVAATNPSSAFYDDKRRVLVMRNLPSEAGFRQRLDDLEFRFRFVSTGHRKLMLKAEKFREAALVLATEGWQVEGEGIPRYIPPGELKLQITSGIDWLNVTGEVQFGDQTIKLPALLQALRRGERFIELPGGRKGLLPTDRLRPLAAIAQSSSDSDALRFTPSQAALVDAICSTTSSALTDDRFDSLRKTLQQGSIAAALDPPAGFVGELRHYQKEALGWFSFLREHNFGGCLADDMGLGKTVQVLAMLEERRQQRHEGKLRGRRPSLVVAPRSLIFNWMQEAARFTPLLRLLDYSGADRAIEQIDDADLVLTTYGTLRRDAADLARMKFDCVILDEAQAIKNASTATAKSVRVLDASHRLALSGTPVENHLGELISLFEFLNPGMLSSTSLAEDAVAGKAMDPDTARLLARAIRPFILRRTKRQVAPELPERTEQTLFVELESSQRNEYDELRNYYQRTLLGEVRMHGLSRMRFQVLEALLRLRQAACHPGLIHQSRIGDSSAKLEAILEQIAEVVEEGHKALVFSQFVGMLSILRKQLDVRGIVYEYLDGSTVDRQSRVERFQSDVDCPLFLISLKAGGVGLNLTAAEYVFLLDPWWNPAVEAQAIDRAHRIGQEKQVFAYRLIAKDTVEEKVLDLQKRKRDLADAIINAPDSDTPLEAMSAADVELLLS